MASLAAVSLAGKRFIRKNPFPFRGRYEDKRKNWAWLPNDTKTSIDDWKSRFANMRDAGINAILPEIYNSRKAFYSSTRLPVADAWLERILPLAKAEGLEVHAWMWSMPCNLDDIVNGHPDWFVVNRHGDSAAAKPAYVPYYKFLCPSHPEVREFVRDTVEELSAIRELDGIHLDYIRYPDVILPEGLQPTYHLHQDREYPQFDYCYCDLCCHDFEETSGIDPRAIDDPSSNQAWLQFRYDRITHLVNDALVPAAHNHGKKISAAVFPNWKNVRQEWPAWNLDAVIPMLYAGFYNEGVDWIADETALEVKSLNGRIPLYSGLMVPQLKPDDLVKAVNAAVTAGAAGVSLFSGESMTDEKWSAFKSAVVTKG